MVYQTNPYLKPPPFCHQTTQRTYFRITRHSEPKNSTMKNWWIMTLIPICAMSVDKLNMDEQERISRSTSTPVTFRKGTQPNHQRSLRKHMPSIPFWKRNKGDEARKVIKSLWPDKHSEQQDLLPMEDLGRIFLIRADGGEDSSEDSVPECATVQNTTPPESQAECGASLSDSASSLGFWTEDEDDLSTEGDLDDDENQPFVRDNNHNPFDDDIRDAIAKIPVDPCLSAVQAMPTVYTDSVTIYFSTAVDQNGHSDFSDDIEIELPQNWKESWTGKDLLEHIYPGEKYLDDLIPHVREGQALPGTIRVAGQAFTVYRCNPLDLSLKLWEQGVRSGLRRVMAPIKPTHVKAFREYARELRKSGEPDIKVTSMYDYKRDVKGRVINERQYHILFRRMVARNVFFRYSSELDLHSIYRQRIQLPEDWRDTWTGRDLIKKMYPDETKYDDLIPHVKDRRAMTRKDVFFWRPLDLNKKLVDQEVRPGAVMMAHIKPTDVNAFRLGSAGFARSGHKDIKLTIWRSKDVLIDMSSHQRSFNRKLSEKL